MVLAREPLSARVWGNASANAVITVTLEPGVGTWKSQPAAPNGSWAIDLPPQPAGFNHTLVFSDGTSNVTIKVRHSDAVSTSPYRLASPRAVS